MPVAGGAGRIAHGRKSGALVRRARTRPRLIEGARARLARLGSTTRERRVRLQWDSASPPRRRGAACAKSASRCHGSASPSRSFLARGARDAGWFRPSMTRFSGRAGPYRVAPGWAGWDAPSLRSARSRSHDATEARAGLTSAQPGSSGLANARHAFMETRRTRRSFVGRGSRNAGCFHPSVTRFSGPRATRCRRRRRAGWQGRGSRRTAACG